MESPEFKPYRNRELELSTEDGVLLWGNRVIIPPPGRALILEELHTCHPGIAHMKTLARMFVWWPCMDTEIEACVKACSSCQSHRSAPPAAPIHPWRWPSTPRSRIHLDFAGPFMGHMFLIVIDAYSKWLEVRMMPSTTSTSLISILRTIFAQFGLPSVIVTDNGRNFTSGEFNTFLSRNGIKHLLSSPYHPSSNGLAERAVQSFKQSMLKVKEGSVLDKVSQVLFYSHITPHSTTGQTPAELLQNRQLKSRMDLIRPNIEDRVMNRQMKQQAYSDLHSKSRHFEVGESIYIWNFGSGIKWLSGHISASVGNVSFEVQLADGRKFIRHIDHIRKRMDSDVTYPPDQPPGDTEETEIPQPSVDPVQIPPVNHSESDVVDVPPTTDAPEPNSNVVDIPHTTDAPKRNSSVSNRSAVSPCRYPKRSRQPPDWFIPKM